MIFKRIPASNSLLLLECLGMLWVFIQNAWVSDDAYITFRSVANIVHGHGPTWNTSERVLVWTHPLWLGIMSALYFLTRDVFYTGPSSWG